MAIYTRGGDKGTTSLIGGKRISKCDLRLEAYGTIDELSAFIANLYDSINEHNGGKTKELFTTELAELLTIINRLMDVGSMFAAERSMYHKLSDIDDTDIKALEDAIDRMSSELPRIFKFTLPVGNTLITKAHIARTVCRRAERVAIRCKMENDISENAMIYINRLSDYLYSMSRILSIRLNCEEILRERKG